MTRYDDLVESIRLPEVLDALDVDVTEVLMDEHWASCPLGNHADVSPSFSVNEEKLMWNCFTCDEGGKLPTLVMALLGLDWDEAVAWLVAYSDGDVSSEDGFVKSIERYLERTEGPPKRVRAEPLPYFPYSVVERLQTPPMTLVDRWNVLDPQTLIDFDVRYDPERHRVKIDYTGPALFIPHFFGGSLVGFQERWLGDRPKKLPKYTNSDDFPRATTLYNYERALRYTRLGRPVVVVESAPTVWRLSELGIVAVGTFGASVRPEQVRLLRAFRSGLVLTQDNDPDYRNERGQVVKGAGIRAVRKLAAELVDHVPVEVMPPVGAKKGDLADVTEDEVLDLYDRRRPVFIGSATD